MEDALAHFGSPEIFNTDRGAQFTSAAFIDVLKGAGVAPGLLPAGAGSAWTARGDGWTTCSCNGCGEVLKYEEVYLYTCEGVAAARAGLGRYFRFYNAERRHQGLGRRTPDAVYADSGSWPKAA